MQLNEILEENSVKAISNKTNISEDNIEILLAGDFDKLKKVRTLGFISIVEREFKADLSALKEQALAYYGQFGEKESVTLGLPTMPEEKKGKSKWFLLLILGLFAYASWYFFTQFDKKQLNELLPFSEEKISKILMPKEELSIENVIATTQTAPVQEDVTVTNNENSVGDKISIKSEPISSIDDTNSSIQNVPPVVTEQENIVIVPTGRLWFGIIDADTQKRDHFSVSEKFEIDIREKSWLLATSSAPFSLVNGVEIQDFDDAREHYFKISKSGIEQLTKADYVAQGGWSQW